MIKISHEAPISMLDMSRVFNDYDYALVHLFETEPVYYDFFVESLKQGRRVLLDNSIFELGVAFDTDKFIEWITKLNPTEYIIPDALEDCQKTLSVAESWMCDGIYEARDSKSIGVVQGKTYGELVKCYTVLDSLNVSKLAISFDYSYYLEVFPHPNKWVSYMMGRVLTINRMLKDGIINKDKPHHLLGCSHPREFSFYSSSDYKWIESLDTSSPIVHGLKGIEYSNEVATWKKESTKLVDLLHSVPDNDQLKTITDNISTFRSYVCPLNQQHSRIH